MMLSQLTRNRQAFSLVQLSAIVVAAGLVAAATIPAGEGESQAARYLLTMKRLEKIEQATLGFMAANGRRPCPASGEYYPGHATFGTEDGSAGDCTDSGSTNGILTPFDDTNVVAGTLPVKVLSLPRDYYFDGWGRPFTYIVDKRATGAFDCIAVSGMGDVRIDNSGGTQIDTTMYAIISHGPDGHGSFQPGGSTRANRLDSGSTDADQTSNIGGGFSISPFLNNWVRTEATTTYDDITWYSEKYKNYCCLGKKCGANLALLNWEPTYYGSFDGTDDYVEVMSDGTGTFDNQSFSITMWIRPTTASNYTLLWSYDYTAHSGPLYYANHIRINKGAGVGQVAFIWNNGSTYPGIYYSVADADIYNEWNHLAVTFTSGSQKMYWNGTQVATAVYAHTITYYAQEVWIGRANWNETLATDMSDVRYYNDVLTADEVSYIANNGATGSDPGTANLAGRWEFTEGTGTTVGDSSSNSNDGTATNITEANFWNP